jgi:hypothetical protein
VVVTGFRHAVNMLRLDSELGRLKVACVVAGVIYALTEAGFRMMHPMWISTMLAAFAVPNSLVPETSSARDTEAKTPGLAHPAMPNAYAFRLRPVTRARPLRERAPHEL